MGLTRCFWVLIAEIGAAPGRLRPDCTDLPRQATFSCENSRQHRRFVFYRV